MGIAQYRRGSQAIAASIHREYMEEKGHWRLQMREQMVRAEGKIAELEQFCRDAQALYIDSIFPGSASRLLESNIAYFWEKKRETKRFKAMLEECNQAHIAWLDSDFRQTFSHLAVCRRKALAWKTLLEHLNRAFKWPFAMPLHL